jgi:hypothetical protein
MLAREPLNEEIFLERFQQLNESERRRLAISGETELALRCFRPSIETIQKTLTRYVPVPPVRFMACYFQYTGQVLSSFVMPGGSYGGCLSPNALDDPSRAAKNITCNPDFDGISARAFLDAMGKSVERWTPRVPWTFADLMGDDDAGVKDRATEMSADALEWFGINSESSDIDAYYSSFFFEDHISEHIKSMLAQCGFTEAFLTCYRDIIIPDWLAVAATISRYTGEAPSAILYRCYEGVVHIDRYTLSIDEAPEDDLTVLEVVVRIKAVRDDLIKLSPLQDSGDLAKILALPHSDVKRPDKLFPAHHDILKGFIPSLVRGLRDVRMTK